MERFNKSEIEIIIQTLFFVTNNLLAFECKKIFNHFERFAVKFISENRIFKSNGAPNTVFIVLSQFRKNCFVIILTETWKLYDESLNDMIGYIMIYNNS